MTERRLLILLLIVFVGLGITYGLTTPLFEAHDEASHLMVVRYLAVNRALPPPVSPPVSPLHRGATGPDLAWFLSYHDPPLYYAPPLYYSIAALLTSWTQMNDLPFLLAPSPSWQAGWAPRPDTTLSNKNIFAHRAKEAFSQSETVRAAYLLRLVSLMLGGVTIVCAYVIARFFWADRPALALGAAAFVAFNPHFIALSSGVTNDNLLNAIFGLFLVGALHLMRNSVRDGVRDGARWTRWALLGGLAGLGLLTKQSALILLPLGGLAILWQKRNRQLYYAQVLVDGSAFLVAAFAVGGWWYIRNAVLYGDLTGLGTHLSSQIPLPYFGIKEALMIFYSYWAVFGWKLILVEPLVYGLFGIVMAAGIAGLAVSLRPQGSFWQLPQMTRRGMGLLSLAILLNGAALARWAVATGAPDGRLLFPTLMAVGVMMAWGLSQLVRLWRGTRYVLITIALLALIFAASVPWRYLRPAFASPRQPVPTTAKPLDVTFKSGVHLIGYETSTTLLKPGQEFQLSLYWDTPTALSHRYHVWVQLGPQDPTRYIAGEDVWLGGTLYPSEMWEAGDTVQQVHRLTIPKWATAPGLYWIRLGLADETSARIPLADGEEGIAVLGPWRMMSAAPSPSPSHATDFRLGEVIRLIGYDLVRRPEAEGQSLELALYWQSSQPTNTDYTVYVHVMGAEGQLISQHDGPPQKGEYPTSWWLPGQVIVDRHTLPLSATYKGPITLRVGMYDAETQVRIPAYDSGGRQLPDDTIDLGTISP